MICPILPPDGDEKQECMKRQCAWFDDVEIQCSILTIADSAADISNHFNPEKDE